MDSTTANHFKNLAEVKVDWTQRFNDTDTGKSLVNEKQDRVIKDLENVLSFLKGVRII